MTIILALTAALALASGSIIGFAIGSHHSAKAEREKRQQELEKFTEEELAEELATRPFRA